MPSTRRSSGRPSAAGGGKQSTLSFNHRVTKSVPKSSKDVAISSTVHTPSPLSKSIEIVAEVQPEEEEEQIELEPESEPEPEPTVPEKSEAEVRAEKLTDAHINKYWRAVEAQRMVKRVHQEDLSVGEKVLRYFDVSSQYGVSHVQIFSSPLLVANEQSHASACHA